MGLYKRGRTWWMSLTYKGEQVRRSTETTDKKLAQKIYHKVMSEIAEGKWFERLPEEERAFKDLAEKYELTVFKDMKDWQSVQGYLNQLKEFFGPYLLNEITPAVIDEFKQKRRAEGVKPSTINRQFNILKRMFNLAKKRWMWIKDVPPIEMESKADKKRVRHISFEEFERLVGFCEDWLRPIVIVASWTGLRQGNIRHLKKTEVNLFSRTITIEGEDMKNGEPLVIPIAAPAFEALKEALLMSPANSQYVFCDDEGRPYNKMKVQRGFKRALKKAGIEDFLFHDLRHNFASWNRQAGVDLDTLADLMGHKDTRMTRRYAHITPTHLNRAIEKLEKSYEAFSTNLSQSAVIGDLEDCNLLN